MQVTAVVHEPTVFLPVVFHEMLFQHIETLCHTLTNGYTWNNDNELAPAVLLVQLEHGLDIDVCLTRSGFHFYIKIYRCDSLGKRGGRSYVIQVLYGTKILQ